jgi:hypothetical protein
MKVALIALLSVWVVTSIGSVVVAAPEQTPTRPGEISPANVWIQNRAPNEAIPVTLVDSVGQPPRVQIVGMVPGIDRIVNVSATAARQAWEYTQVRISANQDAGVVLNTAGADGWEAFDVTPGPAGGTVVLLKRPR